MAKQANRMMIGGFVVLAVIIMAASLVVFGSGKFFKKTNKYILYFDESVKGLSVGAPVLFQGVQVGSVTSITLQADFVTMKTQIPVFIEIEPDRWKVRTGERNYRKVAAKLIEMGLRAQLITQSFITGQLMIELDFYPKSTLCYAPAIIDKDYEDYVVIPTCKSTSERLAQALGDLDLKGIEKHLLSVLANVDRLVSSPDLTASLPIVSADRIQLEQVLVNLLRNAAEARSRSRSSRTRVTRPRSPCPYPIHPHRHPMRSSIGNGRSHWWIGPRQGWQPQNAAKVAASNSPSSNPGCWGRSPPYRKRMQPDTSASAKAL